MHTICETHFARVKEPSKNVWYAAAVALQRKSLLRPVRCILV